MDFPIPEGWTKGELLNVINTGAEFVVTPIFPKLTDPPYEPIHFYRADEAQAFVSWWYAPERGG